VVEDDIEVRRRKTVHRQPMRISIHLDSEQKPYTLKEIGRELGVCRERVRQMEEKAYHDLTLYMACAQRKRGFDPYGNSCTGMTRTKKSKKSDDTSDSPLSFSAIKRNEEMILERAFAADITPDETKSTKNMIVTTNNQKISYNTGLTVSDDIGQISV